MALNELKITEKEISENNVKSAADTYREGDVRSNKNIFDRLPELIARRLNRVIDRAAEELKDVCTEDEVRQIISEAVFEAGSGDMAKAVYDTDGNGMVDMADNGVHKYIHSKIGTVHRLTGTGENIKFISTATWNPGDTLTVNGVECRCWNQNAERIESENIFGNGAVVTATLSWVSANKVWNCFFKSGSGLSDEKLAQADAAKSDVRKGKTFFAGNRELQTGDWEGGAVGTFTSIYNSTGENKVVTVDVGFRPTVVMATYMYDSATAGQVVVIYDQVKPDTYRLWYGSYVDAERAREAEDNFGYIAFTETGFTFRGYYGSSGNKLVHYACY